MFGCLCLPSLNLCLTLFCPSMSRIIYCTCISLMSIPLSPSFTKLLSGMLGIIGSSCCFFFFFLVFHTLLSIDSHLFPLLLFAMFSIAARYDAPTQDLNFHVFPSPSAPKSSSNSTPPLPTDGLTMWATGKNYFNSAKFLLQSSFTSSHPVTCQALLLMGYREIGIGAMTLAWIFISMAIHIAQDLGMYWNANGWRCPAQNWDPSFIPIFSASKLEEWRRIWFGCVLIDQYVSVYIGRPLMIYENDHDTNLPQLTQASLCPSHHLIFQPGLRLVRRSGRSQLQWTIGFFSLWLSCLMFQQVCPALYVLFFFLDFVLIVFSSWYPKFNHESGICCSIFSYHQFRHLFFERNRKAGHYSQEYPEWMVSQSSWTSLP